MRSLGLVALCLLVFAPFAPSQGVTFSIEPKEAALAQSVLVVLDNQSSNTLMLPGGLWPWSMYDGNSALVYAPPALLVSTPVPPRTKMQWGWSQRDRNGAQVPPGAYEARIYFTVVGGGGYQGRAPLTIKPIALLVKGTAAPGSHVDFPLYAYPSANLIYRLALSFGGTPGIALPDQREVPLRYDLLLALSLVAGPPLFGDFVGTLDAKGQATAYVNIPNHPILRGYTIYAAFVTFDPAAPSGIRTISEAASFPIR
ncbi:MAG: hypothetical protein JXQ29_11680 [Planctomycetes bacterium]|nr:hypothetical protein [Planctomycetota bacterium]